jgi:hypothetical protein
MTTIELAGKTVTVIQAIWDRDHGTRNEGWYLRVRYENGEEQDDTNTCIADLPEDVSDATVIARVAAWLYVDGMSDGEQQELRDMIEVRR